VVTSGQILSLTIEKPAAGGRMIARANGQIVLVGGAIPGESVRARIDRVAKGVAYAETLEVESPSPDRRDSHADPLCGGCLYGHIAYRRQLDIKSQVIGDAFQRIGRLPLRAPVPVAPSPEDGYRMRARLHVRGDRIGFFREGTHEVCDARRTRQLLPATCDVVERLGTTLRSLAIDAVREVELSENLDASDRVIFLDAASAIDPRAVERLAALGGISGVVTAFASQGTAHVTDRLIVRDASVSLTRHVLAFFQGNRHLLAGLVTHVVDQVPVTGDVLDLYAGAGVFAVSAALARGVRVTAVEGDRVAATDLVANASASGGEIVAVHQAVEDFVRRAQPVPTAIVDPPRTGLSRDALAGVVRLKAARLIYVSCDVATLARDARHLVDAGYTIDRIDAFDLFPNTPHVETVVVFDRGLGN
jgi:23S rRNA (uracil1939-C5)-methyltransferase